MFRSDVGLWHHHILCTMVSIHYLHLNSLSSFATRYPVFVVTWWITGTMAIACYTAAFVWTMEVAAGNWKIYLGMSMNYSWPVCRLIIAGTFYSLTLFLTLIHIYIFSGLAWTLRDWHWHLRCISALVAVGSVILYWLPESPRWLVAR